MRWKKQVATVIDEDKNNFLALRNSHRKQKKQRRKTPIPTAKERRKQRVLSDEKKFTKFIEEEQRELKKKIKFLGESRNKKLKKFDQDLTPDAMLSSMKIDDSELVAMMNLNPNERFAKQSAQNLSEFAERRLRRLDRRERDLQRVDLEKKVVGVVEGFLLKNTLEPSNLKSGVNQSVLRPNRQGSYEKNRKRDFSEGGKQAKKRKVFNRIKEIRSGIHSLGRSKEINYRNNDEIVCGEEDENEGWNNHEIVFNKCDFMILGFDNDQDVEDESKKQPRLNKDYTGNKFILDSSRETMSRFHPKKTPNIIKKASARLHSSHEAFKNRQERKEKEKNRYKTRKLSSEDKMTRSEAGFFSRPKSRRRKGEKGSGQHPMTQSLRKSRGGGEKGWLLQKRDISHEVKQSTTKYKSEPRRVSKRNSWSLRNEKIDDALSRKGFVKSLRDARIQEGILKNKKRRGVNPVLNPKVLIIFSL